MSFSKPKHIFLLEDFSFHPQEETFLGTQGSALFGVVGTKDQKGNLRVLFTDDNTNTLNVLSAS